MRDGLLGQRDQLTPRRVALKPRRCIALGILGSVWPREREKQAESDAEDGRRKGCLHGIGIARSRHRGEKQRFLVKTGRGRRHRGKKFKRVASTASMHPLKRNDAVVIHGQIKTGTALRLTIRLRQRNFLRQTHETFAHADALVLSGRFHRGMAKRNAKHLPLRAPCHAKKDQNHAETRNCLVVSPHIHSLPFMYYTACDEG